MDNALQGEGLQDTARNELCKRRDIDQHAKTDEKKQETSHQSPLTQGFGSIPHQAVSGTG